MTCFEFSGRMIGSGNVPLVIAEIGINHEGDLNKAKRMIDDAKNSGCECVKFQSHIIEDEMTFAAKNVIPGNASESIYDIVARCAFTEDEEICLKEYAESSGMVFLSTPFSRAAADRLHRMNVSAFKIGSGECNNYPLVEHIAKFSKPVILSTGMNSIATIKPAVEILRKYSVPFALLHTTSLYPTPYEKVRLGALASIRENFPDAIVGLSDHTKTNYTSYAAVALGASIIERHFTSDKSWPGPDIDISMDPEDLKSLIEGVRAIHASMGGVKEILADESVTIQFAYASVVAIKDINKGDAFSMDNLWVKRPGTGGIRAGQFESILGRTANCDISSGSQLDWGMVSGL